MGRYSPDHKPERGDESRGGKHNPLVQGSNPCGPTNTKELAAMRALFTFGIGTENPRVDGSIPPLATSILKAPQMLCLEGFCLFYRVARRMLAESAFGAGRVECIKTPEKAW